MKFVIIFIITRCVVALDVKAFFIENNRIEDAAETLQNANATETERKAFQEHLVQKSNQGLDILTRCLFQQIVEGMQYAIEKHIEKNNTTSNNYSGIEDLKNNSESTTLHSIETIAKDTTSRQKREDILQNVQEQSESNNWNSCVTKSELDQHMFTENKDISSIKSELAKLQQLVQLIEDQQHVLNILNNMNVQKQSKIEQNKDLAEFLQFLKTYVNNKKTRTDVKIESKSDVEKDAIDVSINQLEEQVEKLKELVGRKHLSNSNPEDKFQLNFEKQKQAIQNLIENMKNSKNSSILLSKSQEMESEPNLTIPPAFENPEDQIQELEAKLSEANQQDNTNGELSILGKPLLPPAQPTIGESKILPEAHMRQNSILHTSKNEARQQRAEDDEFIELLQKLLGSFSESNPEVKDLKVNEVESKLLQLEKEIKLASKVHQLEKQLKHIQDSSDSEIKSLDDDDDDDIKSQLKNIQRQIKKLHQSKPQNKGLDEEDEIQNRLKDLQNAIDNLKPSNSNLEGKDSVPNFQSMLSRLLNSQISPAPVIVPPLAPQLNVGQQLHLTPAQIQLLKSKLLAMDKPNSGGLFINNEPQQGIFGLPLSNQGLDRMLPNRKSGVVSPFNFNPLPQNGASDNYGYPVGIQHSMHAQKPYGLPNRHFGNQIGLNSPTAGVGIPFGYKQYGYQVPYSTGPSEQLYPFASFLPNYVSSGGGYGYGVLPGEQYGLLYGPSGYNFQESAMPVQYSVPYFNPYMFSKDVNNGNLNPKVKGKYQPSNYGDDNKQPTYQKPLYSYQNVKESNQPTIDNVAQNNEQYSNTFFPEYATQGYRKDTAKSYKPMEYSGALHAPKSYADLQQNLPHGGVYTQTQIEDLKGQINNLEHVINDLNSPQYIHQSDDQETVYKLDQNISELKNVINNLYQESPLNAGSYSSNSPLNTDYQQPGYAQNLQQTGPIIENKEKIQKIRKIRDISNDGYEFINKLSPKRPNKTTIMGHMVNLFQNRTKLPLLNFVSKHKNNDQKGSFLDKLLFNQSGRSIRQVPELDQAPQNETKDAFSTFLQQISEFFEVYRYFSESLVIHNTTSIDNKTLAHIISRRAPQVPLHEDMIHNLISKITFLMNNLNHITHELLKSNCSCTEKRNTKRTRTKRQTEEEDKPSDTQTISAMASFFRDVLDEVTQEEKSTSQSRTAGDESDEVSTDEEALTFQDNRHKLQQKLDELKKQLDTKMRFNQHLSPHSHQRTTTFLNPGILRKSKGGGDYYQQPTYYYQKPQYSQPYVYPISDVVKPHYSYDSVKDDKGKFKVKNKKSKILDKIFGKILDKILDKIIYSIPKIIQKLANTVFGFGLFDHGYGENYNEGGYGEYGVQKHYGSLGLLSYIPMLIVKITSSLSYLVKKLQKNKFVKIFLIPGAITALIPGLVIFLVWWLTGEDYSYVDNYYQQNSYGSTYPGNYDGDNTYSNDYGGGGGGYNSYNNYRSNGDNSLIVRNNPENSYQNIYNFEGKILTPTSIQSSQIPYNQNANIYKGYNGYSNYFDSRSNRPIPVPNPNGNYINKVWIPN